MVFILSLINSNTFLNLYYTLWESSKTYLPWKNNEQEIPRKMKRIKTAIDKVIITVIVIDIDVYSFHMPK